MSKKKICIVVGTRPEIIKMGPIIKECQKKKIKFFIIHTNQHYDKDMDEIFFKDLQLPKPKYNMKVRSGSHAEITGKALIRIEEVLIKEKPTIVLSEGDTNSVLAAALASTKLHILFGHVEAGLRSRDRNMPEELNRIMVDHISDYLFTPTIEAKNNLLDEGIPEEKISMTGNTIVDAVLENYEIAIKKSKIMKRLKIDKKIEGDDFCLLTFHREENTNNPKKIRDVLSAMTEISIKNDLMIVFPAHPRIRKLIHKNKIEVPEEVKMIKPVGYFDSLMLIGNAVTIFTDSGGIQEEACTLKKPCITLRENTERPETIDVGANKLVGTSKKEILSAFDHFYRTFHNIKYKNPYGDGEAAKKTLEMI